MKLLEIVFWDAVYWLLYVSASFLLWAWTGQGDSLGILVIGFVLTAILNVFLLTQDDILFDDLEPAMNKHVEVYYAEEKERKTESTDSARPVVGFESGAQMRTDVDLSRLDADDDDNVS